MAELVNTFSWSKSRDEVFRRCRRGYYLHYYGYWGGWNEEADRRQRLLYMLRRLKTRPVWVGTAVHEVARRLVRSHMTHKPLLLEKALENLRSSMISGWEKSKQRRFIQDPKNVLGLFEHYYKGPHTETEGYLPSLTQAEVCVRNLYSSQAFGRIQVAGFSNVLELERREQFLVGDIPVFAQLDVAYRKEGGTIEVVDWKTGMGGWPDDYRVQCGVYSLYIQQKYRIPPEQIIFWEVNLSRQVEIPHLIDEQSLEITRSYIHSSAREMLSLLRDPDGNAAEEADFPSIEDREVCSACNFKQVCL